jgi:hypothetical protein
MPLRSLFLLGVLLKALFLKERPSSLLPTPSSCCMSSCPLPPLHTPFSAASPSAAAPQLPSASAPLLMLLCEDDPSPESASESASDSSGGACSLRMCSVVCRFQLCRNAALGTSPIPPSRSTAQQHLYCS